MANGPHQFDKSNLRQVILDAPKQFEEGFEIAKDVKVDGDFERVVFYGEGGSAFPASLVRILIANRRYVEGKLPIPFMQNYTYNLTPDASQNALNVFCSYSGNTEESISTFMQGIEKGLPSIAMASGGKVEEISKEKNIPFVKLPNPSVGFQPRMGTGYFVGAMLQVLNNCGLSGDFKEEVTRSAEGFAGRMGEYEDVGEELVQKIAGKAVLIWSNQMFKELARVWTIKFNEHAKNPAFFNFFSELNHNLMIGMSNLSDQFYVVMLKDPADDPRNLRRYEVTAGILNEAGLGSTTLELVGETVFEKLFNSIYTADFAAYHLSGKNEVDPTPVALVEEFKRRLDANFDKRV